MIVQGPPYIYRKNCRGGGGHKFNSCKLYRINMMKVDKKTLNRAVHSSYSWWIFRITLKCLEKHPPHQRMYAAHRILAK